VQVDNLVPGTYTVSEVTDSNPDGMSLVGGNDLSITVTANNTANIPVAEFTNNKTEVGSLKITKNVTGTTAKDKVFTFEITLTTESGVTLAESYPALLDGQETSNATVESGKVTVTLTAGQSYEILELPARTEYSVVEVEAKIPEGYSQGTHQNDSGTIAINSIANALMSNKYAAEGEIVLHAQKELLGARKLEEGKFNFVLTYPDVTTTQTKSNGADGTVTFDKIEYTQADIYEVNPETGVYSGTGTKEYTYTINEEIPGDAVNADGTKYEEASEEEKKAGGFKKGGYTYDGTVHTITVELTDKGDGTIEAKVAGSQGEAGDTGVVFTNAYGAAGTLKLDAEKQFKNGTLKGGEFTFKLMDAAGEELQSKTNDAAGNVSFDMITYKLADVANSPFIYTVKEMPGTRTDVKYDDATVYTVKVELEDNGDGTLKVTKTVSGGGELKFVNEQLNVETSVTIGGVKVLKGRKLKEGEFKFVLADENGKWIDTAANDADGNFTFDAITYKLFDLKGEKSKVYTYGISEVKGSDSGIIYDKKVYTVKVTVTDNGDGTMTAKADMARGDIRFVNTTSDKTGDEAPLGVLFGGLGFGVAGLAVLLLEDRKKKKNKE
jgi:pilin isopeptide linkage protein